MYYKLCKQSVLAKIFPVAVRWLYFLFFKKENIVVVSKDTPTKSHPKKPVSQNNSFWKSGSNVIQTTQIRDIRKVLCNCQENLFHFLKQCIALYNLVAAVHTIFYPKFFSVIFSLNSLDKNRKAVYNNSRYKNSPTVIQKNWL